MIRSNQIEWLIIDWGSTNFRAFAMDNKGNLVDKIDHKLGLLQITDGKFAPSLQQILSDWLGAFQSFPIVMAGMVGSAQGWIPVPYITTPVNINNLGEQASSFILPWGAQATIIPGVSYSDASGNKDVMRGEEVQLFGLIKMINETNATALFPGTHSKHIEFSNNQLNQFSTYMTGELFSILSAQSILGRDLPKQKPSESAFYKGVIESNTNNLTHQLFMTRTHRLFGDIEESAILDYLSGLLIGYETREIQAKHVYLVGSEKLSTRYQVACQALSINTTFINGDDAFLAGMLEIIKVINHEK
jgi:2-dehydro-3-deoxygalactonokinase